MEHLSPFFENPAMGSLHEDWMVGIVAAKPNAVKS
jgi:hypothetical protein